MTGVNSKNLREKSDRDMQSGKKNSGKAKINEVLESIMSINKDIDNINETNPNNIKGLYQSNLIVGNNNEIKGYIKKSNNIENKNDQNKRRVSIDKNDINLSEINIKIKGYIDSQTNINIIHFSCYDDA